VAEALPITIAEAGSAGVLIVPSKMELEAAVSRADTLEAMLGLDKALALLKEAAEQFRATIDEAARIAASALVTKRRIGTVLLQVDRRGGDRAKSHDATLLDKLMQELGKDKARRYREIARIQEQHFEAYLAATAEQHVVPTEAGAVKLAKQVARASRPRRSRRAPQSSASPVPSQEVLDAVVCVLGEIHVCVGTADVVSGLKLQPDVIRTKVMRGNVFVAECPAPEEWLPTLQMLRRNGTLSNVVMALPPQTGAAWFKHLSDGGWHCFFPTGDGALLAYHGPKRRGFEIALGMHGVVMCACRGSEDSDLGNESSVPRGRGVLGTGNPSALFQHPGHGGQADGVGDAGSSGDRSFAN
jgi:hypothetical protein